MTEEEFIRRYRQDLNLAATIPMDIWEAFANSFGLIRQPDESDGELLERIAEYLDRGKQKPCHLSEAGNMAKAETKSVFARFVTSLARLTKRRHT
jgi:hypothetical protein